ncbi:Hypothetical predicted protein [Cloeon dipterum]|uniref:Large ribosomal subunit protein mL53 n=1 Tax=Cloeon dipterum TaxID=197152 RepID=A0A8S1DN03_9INSE|nr:Hypothetical predicted protein [Cloeon dipterum]
MSIFASGSLKRSAGVIDAIRKQVKLVTLKPAKRIVIKFDPFHEKAPETRKFLLHITNPKIQDTNLNCLVKAEVLSDLSDPSVEVHLNEGGKVTVKSSNLSCLEIFKLYNKKTAATMRQEKQYSMKMIDTLYNEYVPSFTDIFDEDTWYIFVGIFTVSTIIIAFILSKFITLKPVD